MLNLLNKLLNYANLFSKYPKQNPIDLLHISK